VAASAPALTAAPAGRVRPPAVAGTYYPDSPASLTAAARYLFRLAESGPELRGKPVALVLPHAGWPFSGVAAATAVRHLRPGDFARVVVVAPAHYGDLRGYALDDARAYRTPLGEIPLCPDVRSRLELEGTARVDSGPGRREHAVEVLLPLLKVALGSYCLAPVLTGQTTEEQEKACATRLRGLDDGRTLYVFSGDLTHYGPRYDFMPFGPRAEAAPRVRALDEALIEPLIAGNARAFREALEQTKAMVCGGNPLRTFLELLPLLAPESRPRLLAYYASADLPWWKDDNSVGYATLAAFREGSVEGEPLRSVPDYPDVEKDTPPLSADLGRRLTRLARAAVEAEFFGTEALEEALAALGPEAPLRRRHGVFGSLYRRDAQRIAADGRLRGCQGQVLPTYPLDLGTVQAALEAAFRDPRFTKLHAGELSGVQFEVTVLSPPQAVAGPSDIAIGKHGVLLQKDGKVAVFLPQVPKEAGWNVEETLDALAEKAKLPRGAWREGASLAIFTGQVFAEE
jgi:hypothetical protein